MYIRLKNKYPFHFGDERDVKRRKNTDTKSTNKMNGPSIIKCNTRTFELHRKAIKSQAREKNN